jgi:hypothetical protein
MAFKMKFSSGTPFHFHGGDPTDHTSSEGGPKETKFVNTPEGKIAVERQTTIEGKEVEKLAKPGTPEYDKWLAAVTKDPSIEDKYKDQTVTEKRDVDVNLRKTPGVFKSGKFFGVTLEKDLSEEMPMENIKGIFKRAMEQNKENPARQDAIKKEYNSYLKEAGYVRRPTSSTKTDVSEWRQSS